MYNLLIKKKKKCVLHLSLTLLKMFMGQMGKIVTFFDKKKHYYYFYYFYFVIHIYSTTCNNLSSILINL